MVAGGLALGIGAVLLLSNPVGWVVGLTAALSLSAGIAGTSIGASQLVLSYSGQTTAQQDEQLNEATSTMMMFAGSPGGIVGGTAGALYYGNEEGLRRGAFVGGLTEAGVTLAAGSGRMILREIEFGAPANSSWRAVRGGIQDVYGLENAADRMRPNPLFYQGIERMDLSHFVPQRATRGYEWFFNRPWNVTPAWATEHAMVDSFRYQFMSPAFKSVYAGQQLQGLERYLQLAPPWMLQSGYGLSRGGQVGLDWSLGPTPEESSQH